MVESMTVQRPNHSIPSGSPGPSATAALMTVDTLHELRAELERLRRHSRSEITQRLRDARAYGDGSNNDEHRAVREEQIVLEARLRSLEATIARAKVVDPRDGETGVAVIGSEVVIEDLDSGTLSEYRLGSAHETPRPDTISAGSPMGKALVGARPASSVTVELPSGRTRRVRLLEVDTPGAPRTRTLKAA
jgi:transcription elongation factor GreA